MSLVLMLVLIAVVVVVVVVLAVVVVVRRSAGRSRTPAAEMSRQEQVARLENRRGQTARTGRGESAKGQAGLRHSNFGPGGRG